MSPNAAPTRYRGDLARAFGRPLLNAEIRRSPDDFQVTEELGFAPSGDGEHDVLWVRKSGANTQWVARQLARHAGVHERDVGYCGLKDRHAVTLQWFSARRPNRDGTRWDTFAAEGVEIVDVQRNARKLRRGAHSGNRFRVALRADAIEQLQESMQERASHISATGIPNYFGEQRFGRNGQNLDLAEQVFAGKRVRRELRGFAISAARAFLFNAILSDRVAASNWNHLLRGERANLDGTGSVFSVDELTADLHARCDEQDIHPTGTLWGDGAPKSTLEVAELEQAVVKKFPMLADGLCAARIDADSRPLRARVADFSVSTNAGAIWLEFRLAKGAYATAVLREIADYESFNRT
ncbi:MAG: tRNA pseudouridine(13) synthase TruD [Woeseiaceae bacterium]|nr:tRNA pseudouridine(13) synthase TruD [Woeseiaceae bacterium]